MGIFDVCGETNNNEGFFFFRLVNALGMEDVCGMNAVMQARKEYIFVLRN